MAMNREVFIEYTPDFIRAAVFEDRMLCELHIEDEKVEKTTESLFYGRVQQIRPSVGAAFVDIGLEQNGFLPLNETENLRCGDFIIVQGAAKQSVDSKGLRLTTKLNIAGKWLVLVPGGEGVRISKKVKDERLRDWLKETASEVCPADCGLVIRTASADTTAEILRNEAEQLHLQWQDIKSRSLGLVRPGILSERIALDERLVRDLSNRSLERVVVNSEAAYNRLLRLKNERIISETTGIEFFNEEHQLLFDAFQIEEQIPKALKRSIWLDCGGNIVIESFEAMTVIDVNSGKMVRGQDPEENALRVNLEAAVEIARQIRLRDVGGIIVADFIDMKSEVNKELLVKTLRSAVKNDRAQVTVLGLTKLGLMEITRKRVHHELRKVLRVTCASCNGDGEMVSPKEIARRALMQIRRKVLCGQRGPFVATLARKAGNELAQMTSPEGIDVFAVARENNRILDISIEQIETVEHAPPGAVQLKKVKL